MKVFINVKNPSLNLSLPLKVNDQVIFGRSSKSSHQIEDLKISSIHCKLHLKFDRLEIYDLNSKNGTYLNGIRIEASEVFIGDEIKVGDTFIYLDQPKLDTEAIEVLTFPGPFKDRINYELKIDFTGARNQNQNLHKNPSRANSNRPSSLHDKEIAIRKKGQSNIKISKEEIRLKYKLHSLAANVLDGILTLMLISMPFFIVSRFLPPDATFQDKINYFVILEILFLTTYYIINFRILRFSLGEVASGIRKHYLNQ